MEMEVLSVEFLAAVLALLLGVSEFLGLFKGVKSNSVFQLIVGAISKIKDVVTPNKMNLK